MPWDQRSRRRAELPADWPIIRQDVLERDGYRCMMRGPNCTDVATEVNHKSRFDHGRTNLEAACSTCHAEETSRQGNAAQVRRSRPPEPHPGLLPKG
jgi:5-methylcytosine-specific restriction protein A